MSPTLVLPAPAKLNLFLHIIGRREDGYHQLQTIFQFLDYGDELAFEVGDDICELSLSSDIPALAGDDNLIIKAAKLLQKKTGCRAGARIHLKKRLPIGGGVGGGSSDCATTLLALNALWKLDLSMGELAELGLQLGADVPVFVRGFCAFGEGVGEKLTPVKAEESCYLVVVPDVHVDTTQMFRHKDLTRDTPEIKVCAALEQGGQNDFEPLVRRLYPEVNKSLTLLDGFDGSGRARMSGSGACVFVPFASLEQANSAQKELGYDLTSFVVYGKNSSPLHVALKQSGYTLPQ